MYDPLKREITYLRVSVTDRCDLRCFYCMSDDMQFLQRADVLSLEEIDKICSVFVRHGVRKLRITGGEPLVRRGVINLFRSLSRHLDSGDLDELTLTTNASQLATHAHDLYDCGVRRINVSLDTLDAAKFKEITRTGRLEVVMKGLEAAVAAGLSIKINTVALKGFNEDEAENLVSWCAEQGFDLTFIEAMPLGDIGGSQSDHYLPLNDLRARFAARWNLHDIDYVSGGPARYVRVEESGQKIGFITPLSHNFCATCNRMRLTCTGHLYMCLGQDDFIDLRAPLRNGGGEAQILAAVEKAVNAKPLGHNFVIEGDDPEHRVLSRHMSVTGG
jgi:GTP 3',8-cyclase